MLRILASMGVVIIFYLHASATLLPFPTPLPAVSTQYDAILLNTWQGIKKRMVDSYEIPLVHRSRSEEPHDAVSEGVGYGMLLALYCNDQPYFNKIWSAGEQYMWDDNCRCYNWRVDREGTVIGRGPASDAEQDIAIALIFADALVKKGVWKPFKSPRNVDYAERANILINSFWNNLIEEGRYLRPGLMWGGKAFVNPGYFAPAFYRVFDEFEKEHHPWSAVIDQCYKSIAASPGYSRGLVPDWMQPDGQYAGNDQLGYNAYAQGRAMYKDGIRVLWRLATDYLWYGEPRALQFLKNAVNFIRTPERANFFNMDGTNLAPGDSFKLGNEVTRPRSEHSALTVGMWATAAMAAGGSETAEAFSNELLSFYEGGDYWGRAYDIDKEDTLHNEMYFDQFMGWFGASVLSGVFTNLWEDLKDPNPEIAVALQDTPLIEPFDIDANEEHLRISAVFTKNVRWTVEIKHRDSTDVSALFSGSGQTLSVGWGGLSNEGKVMPQGAYHVIISAKGMKTPYTKLVWLGRPLDLRIGNRLLVDNFFDGDLTPFFGSYWGNYTEQSDGKNGKTTIKRLSVAVDEYPPALHWAFRLDGSQQIGFNAYAALEWNCSVRDSSFTLSGLDTLIFTARSLSELPISVQFITSDIGDYTYFEDSVKLIPTAKEYCLPVKRFRQRLGGSGRTLDLSKCTAIRFQVQGPDGTENEIIMENMLFAGKMASFYSSPPPYIPPEPDIGISIGWRRIDREAVRAIISLRTVVFEFPGIFPGAKIDIVSIDGRIIKKISNIRDKRILWNYTASNGKPLAPGCYFAVLTVGKRTYCFPFAYMP